MTKWKCSTDTGNCFQPVIFCRITMKWSLTNAFSCSPHRGLKKQKGCADGERQEVENVYDCLMFFPLCIICTVFKTTTESNTTQVISREEGNIQWYGWLWPFFTVGRNDNDQNFWIDKVPWMHFQAHLSLPMKYSWAVVHTKEALLT